MPRGTVLDLARNVRITEWSFVVAARLVNPGDNLHPLGDCPYCGAVYDDGWTFDIDNSCVVAMCEHGHDQVVDLDEDSIKRIEKLFEAEAAKECAHHALTGE